MPTEKEHLEEIAAFIRDLRSNEASFEKLYKRLTEETGNGNSSYETALQEVKEKAAEEYKKARATGGTAWPEFEKFVSGFETTVTAALRKIS